MSPLDDLISRCETFAEQWECVAPNLLGVALGQAASELAALREKAEATTALGSWVAAAGCNSRIVEIIAIDEQFFVELTDGHGARLIAAEKADTLAAAVRAAIEKANKP